MTDAGPWRAVEAFLALVLRPVPGTRADWPELARRLDELALARWSCPAPDDVEGVEPPRAPDADVKAVLCERFPEFDVYRTVGPLRDDGELDFTEEPLLGDAIDDLLDIVHELRAAVWLREHSGERIAAAHLAWSFDVHWGQHLRDLQGYLHFRLRHA
jgi:hypothetical protein